MSVSIVKHLLWSHSRTHVTRLNVNVYVWLGVCVDVFVRDYKYLKALNVTVSVSSMPYSVTYENVFETVMNTNTLNLCVCVGL